MVKIKHDKAKKKNPSWDEGQHLINIHRRTKSHVTFASEELQDFPYQDTAVRLHGVVKGTEGKRNPTDRIINFKNTLKGY